MAAAAIPFIVVTLIWGLIGGVVPFVIPKGPNRGVIQVMVVMTAVCCYLFWLCTALMQLNPLFGPVLDSTTMWIIQKQW